MEHIACELCGEKRAEEVFRQIDLTHHVTDEEFVVVRCRACGLLYLNPRPSEAAIGKYYPSEYFGAPAPPRRFSRVKRWIMEDFYAYPSTEPAGFRRLVRKLLLWPEKVRRVIAGQVVLPWVGQGRLLDVGCGTGINTAIFKAQGWDVYGLDLSEVAVGHAKTLLGERVQVGDFHTVRYPDRAFDVVRLSHSLEHMYGLSRVFDEVRRIMDDGGMLVIVVPNAGSVEAKLFGRWWFPWELPRHLYHFERHTLVRLLTQAGFSIVRLATGVTPAHFMTSLERVTKHKWGLALPARKWIEKLLIRPLCLVLGNLGYGTEVIVYAVKTRPGSACLEEGRSAAV